MKRPTSKAARPSVVPPYLLDRLAQAADARLSARAVNTLRIDTSQRAVRLAA
ncbi:peptidase M4 family protein, partial [Bordetella pertussis]